MNASAIAAEGAAGAEAVADRRERAPSALAVGVGAAQEAAPESAAHR